MRWRLLREGHSGGAWNMAVDEAVVEMVDLGEAPPTLRLYRWHPPCLSLGFAQPHAVADGAFCSSHGVDVVRRLTGGRAVLHHLELTYSVAAPLGTGGLSRDLQRTYGRICEGLVAGLRRLGVAAELSGQPEGGHVKPTQAVPCFIGPAAGEVIAAGRKLVGSAMRRLGDSVLQHGSILEGWDGELQAGCLGLADDADLRSAVTTVADHVGGVPSGDVEDAIVSGLRDVLDIELIPGRLTPREAGRARWLAGERYGHRRWTVDRQMAAASLQ